MAETIVFVFEGEKTEGNVLDSLKQYYLNDTDDVHVCVTFNTDIYQLYSEIKDDDLDEYLDIVEVLRTRPCNQEDLKDITRKDVAQVFLFFDYDGHANKASDDKIVELLQHFNEETEKGKLYISYPMVEALKHLNSEVSFETVCVSAKENIRYKKMVHENCDVALRIYARLTHDHWKLIISEHCKKLNHLILDSFEFPTRYFPQDEIFNYQLDKHIEPNGQVSVLSAFPVFIVDFYGTSKLVELTS